MLKLDALRVLSDILDEPTGSEERTLTDRFIDAVCWADLCVLRFKQAFNERSRSVLSHPDILSDNLSRFSEYIRRMQTLGQQARSQDLDDFEISELEFYERSLERSLSTIEGLIPG